MPSSPTACSLKVNETTTPKLPHPPGSGWARARDRVRVRIRVTVWVRVRVRVRPRTSSVLARGVALVLARTPQGPEVLGVVLTRTLTAYPDPQVLGDPAKRQAYDAHGKAGADGASSMPGQLALALTLALTLAH